VGADIAATLGAINGLPGALGRNLADTADLTHLRIMMSAAELALLPFELAKVPVSASAIGDGWLGLQPDHPVCITRSVRGVRTGIHRWPTTPKILFVAGPEVPFQQHKEALIDLLTAWQKPELGTQSGVLRTRYLTAKPEVTLGDITDLVQQDRYTHVHILAHGAELGDRIGRFGLALADRVVTGAELGLALTATKEPHLPFVVTVASCDSGQQGSVIAPGGSVAHDLHAAGISLVVASQFPISELASVPFVETLYRGFMWGEHPFRSIVALRRRLAMQFPAEHAWASVVAYECLPLDFDDELAEVRYWQTRRALDTALGRLEDLATTDADRARELVHTNQPFPREFTGPEPQRYEDARKAVTVAMAALPAVGPWAAESTGLRAAARKRTAEVAFWLGLAPSPPHATAALWAQCIADLEKSLSLYTATMKSMLASNAVGYRKATLHWILGQVLLLRAILGHEPDAELEAAARLTARLDLDDSDPDQRAWANVSLLELGMLRLATSPHASAEFVEESTHAAAEVVRLVGLDSEHVFSTRRQMRRYLSWWGRPEFAQAIAAAGLQRTVDWQQKGGVVDTAERIIGIFTARSPVTDQPPRPPSRLPTPTPAPPASVTLGGAKLAVGRTLGRDTGQFSIEMLPAGNGDSLWISYGGAADRHLLIDCGYTSAEKVAAQRVKASDRVELFILTHIDGDHISGAIPLFSDPDIAVRFADVWFNGWKQLRGFLGAEQADTFSKLLDRDDRPFRWNGADRPDDPPEAIVTDGTAHPEFRLSGGMKLTVLSPTGAGLQKLAQKWPAALRELEPPTAMLGRRSRPEPVAEPELLDLDELARTRPPKDPSAANQSSIAVLAEFADRAVLLTGDAHANVLAGSIRSLQRNRGLAGQRLRLDALKVSHHGSANATTKELLDLLDCHNYLISTDGGGGHYHPDRPAIARLIKWGGESPKLYFNYRTEFTQLWEHPALQDRHHYTTAYPEPGPSGLIIHL
jgi:beta-lactamase superfamily II metal-dependent hydrolase